jgi:5-methylcytosine-specific restriction protein A
MDLSALDTALDVVCAVDPAALATDDLRVLAVALEKAAGRLRGVASAALGEVADREPEGTAWWWRDSLGISGEAAGHAVRRATGLRSLPAVSDAVVDGRLSLEQAGALVPLVGKLPELELHDSQPTLIDAATGRTVDSIGQLVRHLIALNSERDLELEQAAAADKRFLKHRTDSDGMVRGSFALTAEEAEPYLTVVEPLSRKTGDDDMRTAGQRRADAFAEVFAGAVRWADLPHAGGQRAQVSYVISAEWAARQSGATPATGAWTGPQTRARIESVLCDARISRVLLDATGQVQRLEAVKDQITLAQRRAVSARDRCCVARGCNRPPAFCDVHHLQAREDGGPTTLDNLALLCRRHHVMWHAGRLLLPDLDVPWLRKPLDPPMVA